MARRFLSLEVREVSLVSAPANPHARVSLFKSAAGAKDVMDTNNVEAPKATDKAVAPIDPEEITKSVRALVEKEFAEKLAAERVEREKLAKTLKLRDKGELVKAVLKSVPGKTEDLTDKLVALEEVDTDLAKFFEGVLKGCAELIEKSDLLKQKSAGFEKRAGTTLEKVEQLVAKALEANPKLTKARAEADVWRENPSLYAEYERERKGE